MASRGGPRRRSRGGPDRVPVPERRRRDRDGIDVRHAAPAPALRRRSPAGARRHPPRRGRRGRHARRPRRNPPDARAAARHPPRLAPDRPRRARAGDAHPRQRGALVRGLPGDPPGDGAPRGPRRRDPRPHGTRDARPPRRARPRARPTRDADPVPRHRAVGRPKPAAPLPRRLLRRLDGRSRDARAGRAGGRACVGVRRDPTCRQRDRRRADGGVPRRGRGGRGPARRGRDPVRTGRADRDPARPSDAVRPRRVALHGAAPAARRAVADRRLARARRSPRWPSS